MSLKNAMMLKLSVLYPDYKFNETEGERFGGVDFSYTSCVRLIVKTYLTFSLTVSLR